MVDKLDVELVARIEQVLDRAVSRIKRDLAEVLRDLHGIDQTDDDDVAYLHRRDDFAEDLEEDPE